jgi:HPP family
MAPFQAWGRLLSYNPRRRAHPSARFYNTAIGHLIGVASGFASVALFQAPQLPSVLLDHQIVLPRVWASGLGLLLTLVLCLLLKAVRLPAGAIILLITLGALKTSQDAINLVLGVFLIAIFREAVRCLRLKTSVPRLG